MIYYVKDNKLYSTDTSLQDDSFKEISVEEYTLRIEAAALTREKGKIIDSSNNRIDD